MASFLGPYYYADPRNHGPPGFGNQRAGGFSRSYMGIGRPQAPMPRFTPYTSSDESDGSPMVVRKKQKPRRKSTVQSPQTTTVQPLDLGKEVVLTTQTVSAATTKSRLRRYFSRQFTELKKELNGPLSSSLSSTTLDNVDELRSVQSSVAASAAVPRSAAPTTAVRHSKSVGDLHLQQGFTAENAKRKTLLAAGEATPKAGIALEQPQGMIQMGEKGPAAARDMSTLGFPSKPSAAGPASRTRARKQSVPADSAPPATTAVAGKSPKSTMQRLEEKFASWFSTKKSAKSTRKATGAPDPKRKIIPTKSSSSSVSSTLLLDSSSSNENPKKPKKKRVDFVLVHKQVESLFYDKRPPSSAKSAAWPFARIRENMTSSEITPAPESGADKSLSTTNANVTSMLAPQLPPISVSNLNNSSANNINNINLHKATTSITSDPTTLFPESDMTSEDDEANWNDGYRLWKERRAAWLQPHPEYLQEQHDKEQQGEDGIPEEGESETARFEDIPEEGYPMVYERLVDKTKTLKKPLNLAFVLKVMKSGWVATGQWPNS